LVGLKRRLSDIGWQRVLVKHSNYRGSLQGIKKCKGKNKNAAKNNKKVQKIPENTFLSEIIQYLTTAELVLNTKIHFIDILGNFLLN